MSSDLLTVAVIGGAAAIASLGGGAVALWRKPTTLFMSIALGFASGVLLATITFSMLPEALTLGSLWLALGGFAAGFAVTVLAGGTSVEELIEGLSIGLGSAVNPSLGMPVALAIAIDNLAEGLAIGEIIRGAERDQGRSQSARILGWTGTIGIAIFCSALAGWYFLRDLPPPALGWLLGSGAGGMFYLTVTDLLPEAEERQYQQLAAVAMAVGFLIVFALSTAV